MTTPLEELLVTTGLAAGSDDVRLHGEEPVLPSRYPLATAAASALAAGGVAAAELWQLSTGRRQRVAVDLDAAAASLMGFAVMSGGPPLPRALPLSELYQCADGRWIHYHGGYPDSPHLSAGILELLDCGDDRSAIAAATRRFDSGYLEDRLAELGLCAAVARSREEWAVHEQGRALDGLAPVEVTKIGESPPEPPSAGPRPLSTVRVLDLTRVLAGPTCARTLAAHGADVLAVAHPTLPNFASFVAETGHGKLAAHLDLAGEAGRDTLRRLVAQADVFSQGYRPGSLATLGFGAEQLAELRPGIVYVSISCYGHVGPWAGRRGWEQLAQTAAGMAVGHGRAGHPQLVPAAACDYTTGYLAALGALVALGRRAREGGSYHVHASLAQTAMWIERYGDDRLEPDAPVSVELGGPPALDPARVTPYLIRSETPYGTLTHLGPALTMSETTPHWARPSAPFGTHSPVWPTGTEENT